MTAKSELLELYNLPLDELLKISSEYMTNNVEFCSLVNAKNGRCSENCRYCAQSSHWHTNIKEYPLIDKEEVIKAALEAKANKAMRFAAVTSGKSPEEKNFEKILEYIDEINKIGGIKSCASLGILNDNQARQLKNHGLDRYHHNINTSKSYYKSICTTHGIDERIETCRLVKKYGMSLCCGVIFGMGESIEQRVETALDISEIQPDSIPVNILMPIKGTPFENYGDKINEEHIMRSLAVLKIANPKSVLRFCGGRMKLSAENQELALKTCVEGIMTGNYLTTTGKSPEEDLETVKKLGKHLLSAQ